MRFGRVHGGTVVASLVLALAASRLVQERFRAIIRVEFFTGRPYGTVPWAVEVDTAGVCPGFRERAAGPGWRGAT